MRNVVPARPEPEMMILPSPTAALTAYAIPDLRLRPGSATEDAGVAIPNINDGFRGAAPDAGARIVTVSPDVGTSTNLGGWINKVGIWGAVGKAAALAMARAGLSVVLVTPDQLPANPSPLGDWDVRPTGTPPVGPAARNTVTLEDEIDARARERMRVRLANHLAAVTPGGKGTSPQRQLE